MAKNNNQSTDKRINREVVHKRLMKKKVKNIPPNVQHIIQLLDAGKQCCVSNCIRTIYEYHEQDLIQFGKDLMICSRTIKETALLMNLREHVHNPAKVQRGVERQRQCIGYALFPFGSMCRTAYLLIWDIGLNTFKKRLRHMTDNHYTFRPQIHGHVGSISNIALSPAIRNQAVRFILDLAASIGEESEGRWGQRNLHAVENRVVRFLPAPYSIALLYRQFLTKYHKEHPQYADVTPLSLSSFRSIFFSDPCKHIRIRSPRSDVCDECAMYRSFYKRQQEHSEGDTFRKEEDRVSKWQHHLQLSKEARLVYNEDIKQAQKTLQQLRNDELQLDAYVAHYTFDFMQNLAIPNFADMTKDMYFFSLRNINVFSIRDDGEGKQFNYLYDEGDGGKGANYVISLLFYFLIHRPRSFAALIIHLHADNCCGQNKNNIVMQFFLFLVSLGFLHHTELKFMIRGHTHCTVDGGHGIIKKEWRKRDVFTIEQAAKVIEETSPVAGIHYATVIKPEHFFNWEEFLSKYFKKLLKLLSFQQFEMDESRPGVIRHRLRQSDPWQEAQLFKKGVAFPPEFSSLDGIQGVLTQLEPPSISEKKQKHLYEKVRPYVPLEFQDIVCPRPGNYQESGEIL